MFASKATLVALLATLVSAVALPQHTGLMPNVSRNPRDPFRPDDCTAYQAKTENWNTCDKIALQRFTTVKLLVQMNPSLVSVEECDDFLLDDFDYCVFAASCAQGCPDQQVFQLGK